MLVSGNAPGVRIPTDGEASLDRHLPDADARTRRQSKMYGRPQRFSIKLNSHRFTPDELDHILDD